jgi:hypothetical protein
VLLLHLILYRADRVLQALREAVHVVRRECERARSSGRIARHQARLEQLERGHRERRVRRHRLREVNRGG